MERPEYSWSLGGNACFNSGAVQYSQTLKARVFELVSDEDLTQFCASVIATDEEFYSNMKTHGRAEVWHRLFGQILVLSRGFSCTGSAADQGGARSHHHVAVSAADPGARGQHDEGSA